MIARFLLFDSHCEAIITFTGLFVVASVFCLLHYMKEKDKYKRKGTLVQRITPDAIFAVVIGIVAGLGLAVCFVYDCALQF